MTDKITIEREALERAVTALVYHQQQTRPIERTQIAIRALRAALAAQPAKPSMDATLRNAARRSATIVDSGRMVEQAGAEDAAVYDAIAANYTTRPAEPVALGDALRWSKATESHGVYVFTPAQLRVFYEYATRAVPPAQKEATGATPRPAADAG